MKKQNNSSMTAWMVLMVYTLAVSSCVYHLPEEDWEKNGKVRLLLDWQTQSNYPSDMTYYFYKDGTGRPVIRSGRASGYEGTLPSGQYRVVVCNTDCDNVELEMDNGYERAFGKARQISALKSASVHIAHPGNLYGTGCQLINVEGERTVVEELYPSSLVKTLELNIKVTGGGGDIDLAGLSGRLTGVSAQVHIPTGKALFAPLAFIAFEPEPVRAGVYTSLLDLFGLSGTSGNNPVELYLTLKLTDGKELSLFTNISREVGDAFDKSVSAHIILDLEITYDGINGATLVITGWKEGTGEVVG